MSLVSVIARTVTGSLKLGSRPTEPDYQPNEYVKLRHTNITNLRDPRFTKDQWDKLMANTYMRASSERRPHFPRSNARKRLSRNTPCVAYDFATIVDAPEICPLMPEVKALTQIQPRAEAIASTNAR